MKKYCLALTVILAITLYSCNSNQANKQESSSTDSMNATGPDKAVTNSGASKEETEAWILSKLNGYCKELNLSTKRGGESIDRHNNFKFQFAGNKLVCEYDQVGGDILINLHDEVSVKDIDAIEFYDFFNSNPSAGESGNSLRIGCRNDAVLQKVHYLDKDRDDKYHDNIWFGFRCDAEKDLQQRLTKAFQHLKELAGNSTEIF